MVYMAGDNSLQNSVPAAIAAMAAAPASANVTVIVQEETTTALVNGSTTAKRLKIQGGTAVTITDLGEIDSANPANITNFVQWAVATYTGMTRYVLILWDHGGQYIGWATDVTGAGTGPISYANLKTMLTNIQTATGIAKFDMIGFDACLMAGLEIDLLLSSFAKYRVCSCEVEWVPPPPLSGMWDYHYWLSALAANPAMSTATLGQNICDGFIAVRNGFTFPIENQTLSVGDLSQTAALVSAVNALSTSLSGTLAGQLYAIAKSRRLSTEYGATSSTPGQFIDLRDFASRVSANCADPGLVAAATATVNAVDTEIIYKVQGGGEPSHGGVSIYFPVNGGVDPVYTSTVDLALTTGWPSFLSSYQTAIASDTIGPSITINSPANGTSTPLTINFTISGNDVATDIFDAGAWLMTSTGATTYFIQGDVDFGNLTGGSYNTTWDGTAFVLWDGTSPNSDWLCALSPHVAGNTYEAKMKWVRGATALDVSVFFQLNWAAGAGNIQGVYFGSPSGLWIGIPLVPGDTLTMYRPILDTSSGTVTWTTLSPTTLTVPTGGVSAFQIYTASLGTGTHDVFIFGTDYAGNVGGALGSYSVP